MTFITIYKNKVIFITSYLKIKILGQDQGGFDFRIADILKYFENLEIEFNAEFGPKDYFEMACKTILGYVIYTDFVFMGNHK